MPRNVRVRAGLSFIPFQIPSLVESAPAGDGWLHEIKQDGYRTQIIIDRGTVRAFTRSGYDWTKRYPSLTAAAAILPATSAILDGEAVVQDERGVSDFGAFRAAMSAEPHRVILFAFDLLHIDGKDIRKEPLTSRRDRLRKLLAGADPALQFSEAIEGDGRKVFAAAEALGVEGIVSKRAAGRYESGRSREWLKTKCMTESEFVVIGVEPNPGGPPFALLAREEADGLTYAGSVFVTLPQAERDTFWKATELLKVKTPTVRGIRGAKASFFSHLAESSI